MLTTTSGVRLYIIHHSSTMAFTVNSQVFDVEQDLKHVDVLPVAKGNSAQNSVHQFVA
jgi:hypothetical protein